MVILLFLFNQSKCNSYINNFNNLIAKQGATFAKKPFYIYQFNSILLDSRKAVSRCSTELTSSSQGCPPSQHRHQSKAWFGSRRWCHLLWNFVQDPSPFFFQIRHFGSLATFFPPVAWGILFVHFGHIQQIFKIHFMSPITFNINFLQLIAKILFYIC